MHPKPRPLPLAAAVGIALALAGCLGDPAPRTCADYPPGTPGCALDRGLDDGAPPDGDPADARDQPDDRLPDGGIADRGEPADATPDRGTPDADLSDADPPDRGEPDLGTDLGTGDPCEPNPCGPPPDALCVGDRVLLPSPARCLPLTCAPGDLDCDPGVLQCSALLACRLACLFDRDADGCDAACVAAAPAEAIARYDAVEICADDSGCEDDSGQFECLRAACGEAIAACTGDPALVWFVRQRFPARGRVCDYPAVFGPDCGEIGKICDAGACLEHPLACDNDADCADLPPPVCEGDRTLVTASAPSVCDFTGPFPRCAHTITRAECPLDQSCDAGVCIDPPCEPICDARVVVSCDARGDETRLPCERDAWCTDGICRAIPAAHGTACRDAMSITACERAGFICGGLAAVPFCALPGSPRAEGETCFAGVDCHPDLRCTRAGRCSTGARGTPCLENADCEASCGRGGSCL